MKILIPFVLFAGLLGFEARSDAQAPANPSRSPTERAPVHQPVPPTAETRERYLFPAEPGTCCEAVGGPDDAEGLDLSRIDALLAPPGANDETRWRLPNDHREAQRVTPTPPGPLNRFTIPF